MELREYIKLQHLTAHLVLDGDVLAHLSDKQLRMRPEGAANSVAWLLWHTTRCEDVAINAIVRTTPQVLIAGGWIKREGLAASKIGTGMGDDEVARFCEAVDLDALRDYRAAVRKETAAWLDTLDPALRQQRPDLDERIEKAGDLWDDAGAWVRALWGPWPNAVFVNWVAIGHTILHTGEMRSVMLRMGIRGR